MIDAIEEMWLDANSAEIEQWNDWNTPRYVRVEPANGYAFQVWCYPVHVSLFRDHGATVTELLSEHEYCKREAA